MTEREALKLALEALKQIDEAMPFPVAKLAQKAIREALAQPEHGNPAVVRDDGNICYQYTTPPQRTWVGLTSVDWNDFNAVKSNDPQYVAAWAEAKLKEKNT